MNTKEKFIFLVNNDKFKKADAIIVLEGDGFFRLDHAAELYHNKWSKTVVISGNSDNPDYGSFPAKLMKKKLVAKGVPSDKIILEENSTNTLEQAQQIIKMAKKNLWKRFFLVASHYHQPRAFLTFLRVLQQSKSVIEIINAPCKDLDWFSKNSWGLRIDLLELEFKKISIYQKKGHVASYNEAIEYQKWKEK